MFGDWGQLVNLSSQICVNCGLRLGQGDIFPWTVWLRFYNCWTQTSQHLPFFWEKTYWNSSIFDLKHDGKQCDRSLARLKRSGTMNLLQSSHRWKAGQEKLHQKTGVDSQKGIFLNEGNFFSLSFQEFWSLVIDISPRKMIFFFNIDISYSTWCICEISRLENRLKKRLRVMRTLVNHREIRKYLDGDSRDF